MKRLLVLASSILVSFCLGGVYAWSAFVPALREEHSLTAAQCQAIFGTTIALFTIVMVPAGRLLPRLGPRVLVAAGGTLLSLGYLSASLGHGSFGSLILGLGVVGGAGIGLAYVCPITVCVRWFPSKRGLITGLTVCGFGAGGVGVASIVNLLQEHDMRVLEILRWLGLAYGTLILPAAILVMTPKGTESNQPGTMERVAVRLLLRRRDYRVLAAGMFAGTFSGLMIIGNLRSIGLANGIPAASAMLAISLFAIGNAAGRICWGWLVDRYGRKCIPASLALLGIAIGTQTVDGSESLFLIASAGCGFAFGACFVVYPAQVAERFGTAQLGAVYPLVFLLYGLSGILGPVAGGKIFDITSSFQPAMLTACFVAATGAIITILMDGRAQPQHRIARTPVLHEAQNA